MVGAWEQVYDVTNSVGDRLLQGVNRVIGTRSRSSRCSPFYDPADFPWVAPLETNWKVDPRASSTRCSRTAAALPNFQDISIDQIELTDDDRWKTFFFYGYGFEATLGVEMLPARPPR